MSTVYRQAAWRAFRACRCVRCIITTRSACSSPPLSARIAIAITAARNLLRLQDILFHRELGVPLAEIASPARRRTAEDRLAILTEHRTLLADRVERSRQLLRTIDRTIAELEGGEAHGRQGHIQGLRSGAKQAEYEEWLVERYGGAMRERIEASKAKLRHA